MRYCKRSFVLLLVMGIVLTSVPMLWAGESGKVNINTASVEEIAKLEKIGQKYAERIVQYRKENGPFKKAEDITNVKGIGPKTFELNKDRITVE